MAQDRDVEAETRYAQAGDLNIAYKVFGEGPINLVFVPGIVSNIDIFWTLDPFIEFMERLASFARVVIFDKRGTGLSDPTPGAAELDERMDDVRAVMDAVGMESAAILGLSEGGPLAALFAATYPERTKALVLCGSFGRIPQGYAFRDVLEDAVEHWGEGKLALSLAPSLRANAIMRRMIGFVERASASPQMMRSLFDCIAKIDVRSVLPSITAPTLAVHRRDEVIPLEMAQELVDGIDGARLVVVEGDDHLPWLGDVEAYIGPIEEFLTGSRHHAVSDRALATVLFTDIATSTERNAAVGDEAWRRVLDQHNGIVRDSLREHRGREIKTMGDGFLATFDGPARALRCARTIVERVREAGVEVRVGVHTGEVEVYSDGDVGGMAVNLGARVGAAASPGEVLVSSTVKDLVFGSGFRFVPRGAKELKGVPGEWSLFALEGEGAAEVAAVPIAETLGPFDRAKLRFASRNPKAMRAFGRLIAPKPAAER
jgi:pimeloyl-ACP methyl ester carboxylesterase